MNKIKAVHEYHERIRIQCMKDKGITEPTVVKVRYKDGRYDYLRRELLNEYKSKIAYIL